MTTISESAYREINRRIDSFAAEMRAKGIHVGLGPKGTARCVTTTTPAKGQTVTTLMGDILTLDADGFSAELNAYLVRDQDGHWVTIPVD